MARPKSDDPRTAVATARLLVAENERLEQARDIVGESRSDFVRVAIADRVKKIYRKDKKA